MFNNENEVDITVTTGKMHLAASILSRQSPVSFTLIHMTTLC
uniref:Uncharacterized protein n=1 Tax=Anguilla anguilla TaxID=7936 RepID=A0A0E9T835_ANGAN